MLQRVLCYKCGIQNFSIFSTPHVHGVTLEKNYTQLYAYSILPVRQEGFDFDLANNMQRDEGLMWILFPSLLSSLSLPSLSLSLCLSVSLSLCVSPSLSLFVSVCFFLSLSLSLSFSYSVSLFLLLRLSLSLTLSLSFSYSVSLILLLCLSFFICFLSCLSFSLCFSSFLSPSPSSYCLSLSLSVSPSVPSSLSLSLSLFHSLFLSQPKVYISILKWSSAVQRHLLFFNHMLLLIPWALSSVCVSVHGRQRSVYDVTNNLKQLDQLSPVFLPSAHFEVRHHLN